MTAFHRIASLALLMGLVACSAAMTPTVPAGTGNDALSSATRERHRGKLVLRFKIPKKHHRIRIVRDGRPQYVSPATQSLSLSITGPTNVSEAVGLTVNSGNCTSTLASTFCTLTIPSLAVGTGYQISVATYDGPIVGSAPSGNLLSRNQNVGFSIVAGQTNNIQLTLGGVATSLAITPLNHALRVDENGYALYGNLATTFLVTPLDADNNPIIGPGAPAPAASLAPGAQAQIAAVGSSNPNAFTITGSYSATDPTVPSQTSLTISATPVPGSGGSTVTQTVALNQYQPWIYVIDSTATTIQVFDEAGNALSASTTFTTPSGCQNLGGLAYGQGQIYGFYSYSGGTTACIVTWSPAGGPLTSYVADSNIPALGDDGDANGAAFDPHNNELYIIGSGYNGGAHYIQSYNASLTKNYNSLAVGTSGNYGVAYLPLTNQIVATTANSTGIFLCNEALSSCNAITGIGSVLSGGPTYDPYTGYLGAGAGGGLNLYDLSGTKEGFIGFGTSPSSVAFDPYQADYIFGYSITTTDRGIWRFTEGNKQISGGFTSWPLTDLPGQIIVVP